MISKSVENDYKSRAELMSMDNRGIHGLHEDALIVLAMVLKDQHSLGESLEAVRVYGDRELDDTYFHELQSSTENTLEAYREIQEYNQTGDIQDEIDGYRRFANEYMTRKGMAILDYEDDLAILHSFYDTFIQNTRSSSASADYQNKIAKSIRHMFTKALLEASPVAREAGRNPEKYVASVMEEFKTWQLNWQKMSNQAMPITKELYVDHLKRYQRELDEYRAAHSKECMDVMVVKELLEEQQNKNNIYQVLLENSPVVKDRMIEKEAKAYANRIIEIAHKVRKAEIEIIHSKVIDIPEKIPYRQLRDKYNISAIGLFRQTIRQRIEKTPSFLNRLLDPISDQEAVENILANFPDIDRFELRDAIRKASPRAQMPDAEETYVDRLLLNTEWRLSDFQWKQKQKEKVANQYKKLQMATDKGLGNPDKNAIDIISSRKDSMIAVKMLRQNEDDENIIQVLISMSSDNHKDPIEYARHILRHAKRIIELEDAIHDYQSSEDKSASNDYMIMMKKLSEKSDITPAKDEKVAENMLAKGWRSLDVIMTIRKYSPRAIESEDVGNYSERIVKGAMHNLNKSKQTEQPHSASNMGFIPHEPALQRVRTFEE